MPAARTAVAVAALAALAFAPAASGAAKVCNLVVDSKGDQRAPFSDELGMQMVSDDLDIVSADIAANKSYLTGVVRVVSLRETDPDAATGRWYEVGFTVNERKYSVRAALGPDGYSAAAWDDDAGRGLDAADVIFDHARREVRITAQSGTFGIAKGTRLSAIRATTGQHIGTNGSRSAGSVWIGGGGGMTQENDYAKGARGYVAGTPSCVTVGR